MDYLVHHGIKNQKWGIRRYQNEDGTYTEEGKRRRREEVHPDYKRAHDKKKVSQMSDQELRDRNNRLQAERQYKDLTKNRTYEKGKKIVKEALWISGTTVALIASYKKLKPIVQSLLSKIGGVNV